MADIEIKMTSLDANTKTPIAQCNLYEKNYDIADI